jgi:hypothetical protein
MVTGARGNTVERNFSHDQKNDKNHRGPENFFVKFDFALRNLDFRKDTPNGLE